MKPNVIDRIKKSPTARLNAIGEIKKSLSKQIFPIKVQPAAQTHTSVLCGIQLLIAANEMLYFLRMFACALSFSAYQRIATPTQQCTNLYF
jgi:hypothetical protein